ncbi:MAG: hypothetical protein Q8P83_00115 [bacterium]|nr:hypothetical protein [bacterium]
MLNKKLLFSVFALLLVLFVVFWLINSNQDKKESFAFAGNVESVGQSSMIVNGLYTFDGKPIDKNQDSSVKVEILINDSTKITKESFKIPEGSEVFYPDELPKETTQVNLEQIKEDLEITTVGIWVEAEKNIYGKKTFTAKALVYRVPDLTDEIN